MVRTVIRSNVRGNSRIGLTGARVKERGKASRQFWSVQCRISSRVVAQTVDWVGVSLINNHMAEPELGIGCKTLDN